MALEIRQQLKLSQQLVMTPQLQQAIKLLQLSRMELMDVVREELEENPVLEEGQEAPDEKTTAEEELTAEKPDEQVQETVQEVKVIAMVWRTSTGRHILKVTALAVQLLTVTKMMKTALLSKIF